MYFRIIGKYATALLLASTFAFNANAAPIEPRFDFTFNFTGECDDCAFNGSPTDIDFNPFDDGLTQTVSATLRLTGMYLRPDGTIESRGDGTILFSYGGSSLINAFSITDPFLFTSALLPTGQVKAGETFQVSSSVNVTDPDNPLFFDFPNFCTPLGAQVLSPVPLDPGGGGLGGSCDVGLVSFELNSTGDWSVSGEVASDVGSGGQFTSANAIPEPGTVALLAISLAGFGFTRKRKAVNDKG